MMLGADRCRQGGARPLAGRNWWFVACLVFVAGMLPLLEAGSGHTQATDDVSLGDVTGWTSPQFLLAELDGVLDTVDYFSFSLNSARVVGLGLRRLDFDADLFLENSSGSVLASSRRAGTAKEWISVELAAGQYALRVVARESGLNEYRVRVGTWEALEEAAEDLVVAPAQLTISEGGLGTFTVKLATQPTGPVTVTLAADDAGAVAVPAATLTFTSGNWDTPQAVTVEGAAGRRRGRTRP